MAYIKERGNNNYFVRVSCGTLDNGRPFQKSRLFRPSRVNLPESKVRKELDAFVKALEEECRIEFETKRQSQTNFELSEGETKHESVEKQVNGDHQSMILVDVQVFICGFVGQESVTARNRNRGGMLAHMETKPHKSPTNRSALRMRAARFSARYIPAPVPGHSSYRAHPGHPSVHTQSWFSYRGDRRSPLRAFRCHTPLVRRRIYFQPDFSLHLLFHCVIIILIPLAFTDAVVYRINIFI